MNKTHHRQTAYIEQVPSPTDLIGVDLLAQIYQTKAFQETKKRGNCLEMLTKRLMNLLLQSPNQTIDLNQAASLIKVHKRRIYDITNVLEGIGYVRKLHRNFIQWIGAPDSTKASEQMQEYRQKIEQLEKEDTWLDSEIKRLEEQTNQLLKQALTKPNLNLTDGQFIKLSQRLCTSDHHKLFIVSAPKDSLLEVDNWGKTLDVSVDSENKGQVNVYCVSHKDGKIEKLEETAASK